MRRGGGQGIPSVCRAVFGLLALTSGAADAGTPPPGFTDTQLVSDSSVSGVSFPTGIAYEPGTDHLWILEKGSGSSQGSSRVRVRHSGTGAVSTAYDVDCVDSRGERGLLGIAFDPEYLEPGEADRFVYIFYTRRIAAAGTCAIGGVSERTRIQISRFTESGMSLSGEEVVFVGPTLSTSATNHNGGTIRFAPDGTLFVSIGDNDTDHLANPASRDLDDLRGKLLRINKDGSVPLDNPFVGKGAIRPEIWAWGLRNPFRFTIDEKNGAPVIADVGESTWEIVYLGVAGADYGYPCVEGSAPFRNCNPAPPAGSVTEPIFVYGHGSQTLPVSGNSITGGPVYRADAFPDEYHGSYFFGDWGGAWIRRGRFDATGRLVDVELFVSSAGSVVDMAVSPEGCLTYALTNGGVQQTCYTEDANGPPWAIVAATPTAGPANLSVDFTGSGSDDPDGDPLLYDWDFDHGSNSSLADPSHLYTSDGVYEAILEVDDQQGEVNSVDTSPPIRIVVGNEPPTPTIDTPAAGTGYTAGETIAFSGSATDPEDGAIPAADLGWTVVFHHGDHTHPVLGTVKGITAGSFDTAVAEEGSTSDFFRLHLTATDSGSPLGSGGEVSATTHVDIPPNVQLGFEAIPPGFGIELEFDGQSFVAPGEFDSAIGFPRTLNAPSSQMIGGREFFFQSWSDAGAAEHEITTPVQNTTYIATFAATCSASEDVVLDNQTVTTEVEIEACDTLTAGPAYVIDSGGDVTFIAGGLVTLNDGFSVTGTGTLRIVKIPEL